MAILISSSVTPFRIHSRKQHRTPKKRDGWYHRFFGPCFFLRCWK